MARRDDREYREYLSEEQRSQAGCIARRMQRHLHHGLPRLVVLATAVGIAVLGSPRLAGAQEPQAPSLSPLPSAAPEVIDLTKLGIDLSKIQKGLVEGTIEERRAANGLRIDYRIQVFGRAPALDLFETFDPVDGPVPFGAPTHRDFLNVVTPQEFRSPPASISNLAFWAIQKLSERGDRQRCEEELARYKADVMAGLPVAAPSCAR